MIQPPLSSVSAVMSTDSSSTPFTLDAAVDNRNRLYLLVADAIHLSCVGCAMGYLLFAGTGVSTAWCVICTVLLMILLARSGGWAVLLAIQIGLLLRDGRSYTPEVDIGVAVYAFASLAILAYACSFHTLRFGLRRWLAQRLRSLSSHESTPAADSPIVLGQSTLPQTSPTSATMTAQESQAWADWRARGLVRLMVILLIAMAIFSQLPISSYMRDVWWQRSLTANLKFWPGPGLIVFLLSGLVILAVLSSRQMTRSQARLMLRSWMVKSHFSDMRRMIIRQMKREMK